MGSIIKHGPILDRVVGDKIQNYKIIREEFLRQQKDVKILRSEKVDELYGKEDPQYYPQDEIEKSPQRGKGDYYQTGIYFKGSFFC